jgi:hypothetical protein
MPTTATQVAYFELFFIVFTSIQCAGYVDDCLRDGREMLREAAQRRRHLQVQVPA